MTRYDLMTEFNPAEFDRFQQALADPSWSIDEQKAAYHALKWLSSHSAHIRSRERNESATVSLMVGDEAKAIKHLTRGLLKRLHDIGYIHYAAKHDQVAILEPGLDLVDHLRQADQPGQ